MSVMLTFRSSEPAQDLSARLVALLAPHGFELEAPESPHRLRLSVVRHAKGEAVVLEEQAPFQTCAREFDDLAKALAVGQPMLTGYDAEGRRLLRWEHGERVISLASSLNGEFRGQPWSDLDEDESTALATAIDEELGAEALAALRNTDERRAVEAVLERDLGPRDASPPKAVTLFRRQVRCEGAPLEQLFQAARKALTSGDAPLGFLGTASRRGERHIAVRASDQLKEAIDSGSALSVGSEGSKNDLLEVLRPALAALQSDPNQDLFLGRTLGLEIAIFPGYAGRNPRTGEPIPVPAKRVPMLHWLEAA